MVFVPPAWFVTPQMCEVLVKREVLTTIARQANPASSPTRDHVLVERDRAPPDLADLERDVAAGGRHPEELGEDLAHHRRPGRHGSGPS